MATTWITFADVEARGVGVTPVLRGATARSETLTPSGSNQQSTNSAKGFSQLARVVSDVAVYVAFGADPDATTAASRIYLPANVMETFAVGAGDKVAVVTV